MGLQFKISQDAEVISSIGVGLARGRETIQRVIPNPTSEDVQRIKREAFDAVVRLGAAPENVEVTIEVDPQMQRVRAIAMGASEMRAQDLLKDVTEEEALGIAAASMGLPAGYVQLAAATDQVRVFQGTVEERKWRFFKHRRQPVRAVDREGVIRVQRSHAVVLGANAGNGVQQLRRLWEEVTVYNGDSVITPDVFLIAGRRVLDLSGINTPIRQWPSAGVSWAAGPSAGGAHQRARRAGSTSAMLPRAKPIGFADALRGLPHATPRALGRPFSRQTRRSPASPSTDGWWMRRSAMASRWPAWSRPGGFCPRSLRSGGLPVTIVGKKEGAEHRRIRGVRRAGRHASSVPQRWLGRQATRRVCNGRAAQYGATARISRP
jgi:hypothetical protein